jgi:transposase
MRGKKGIPHRAAGDPPRRRANKARGHGTWAQDRPAVAGVVGRDSEQLQLEVVTAVDREHLEAFVTRASHPGAMVFTDEWAAYHHLPETGRGHASVCHTPGQREWARDDDGDGVREVHNNTLEGTWTGLRNFLRPFRGVSKWFLDEYVGIFQWAHNLKAVTSDFLRALVGLWPTTCLGT